MKRSIIAALIATSFTASFAQAACDTASSGLVSTCDDTKGDTTTDPQEPAKYGVGEMPYTTDHNGLVDKINFLDNGTTAAHDRLNHDDDRLNALSDQQKNKVDVDTFVADQQRQDKRADNTEAQAQDAQQMASIANENTGIVMNKQAELETTVTANRERADAQVGRLKTELNQKVDNGVYTQHVQTETADRADLRDQTQKLWADKASTANVDEVRASNAQESKERIAMDKSLEERKADKSELNGVKATANVANAKADVNAQNITILNENINRQSAASFSYTDQQVGQVRQELGDMKAQQNKDREEYRGGISAVAAMANIPSVAGHKFDVGVGLGNFANSTSVAVGMHYRPSENNVFKASAGASNTGKGAVGIGYSYGF